eukprot:scaffold156785_cov76-Attheya_sp.AAC.1
MSMLFFFAAQIALLPRMELTLTFFPRARRHKNSPNKQWDSAGPGEVFLEVFCGDFEAKNATI